MGKIGVMPDDLININRAAKQARDGILNISHSNPELEIYALTRRQWDVLELMAQGYSNSYIASQLFIAERTVEQHINQIFSKLLINATNVDISARVQAVLAYQEIVGMDKCEHSPRFSLVL